MKRKIAILVLATTMGLGLTGCGNNEYLKQERAELKTEISALQAERDALKDEVIEEKIKHGTEVYVVTVNVSQSHMIWDYDEMIKDSMNDVSFEMPVSKEFYDSVEPGTVLNNDFRMGSFVMHGSIGSWNITVEKKEIR